MLSIFISGVAAVLVWLAVRHFVRAKGRLPPGPLGFPLIGVLPFLTGKHPQEQITEWGKKYGSVYSMYIGQQLTVVLNDYDAIRSAYVEQADVFTGRPHNIISEPFSPGGLGIVFSEGEFFRAQRRLMLRAFHDLGVGKSRFEQLCLEEVDTLVEELLRASQNNANSFEPNEILFLSVANTLAALLFGKRFSRTDTLLLKLVESQRNLGSVGQQAGPLIAFPRLRFFPPMSTAWQRLKEVAEFDLSLMKPEVEHVAREYEKQCQKQNEEFAEPHCVTEQFLRYKATSPNDSINAKLFDENNILSNVATIFGAGSDTSVITLLWTMVFFLHHPEVQQKGFEEIVEKVGSGRPVSWNDRQELPYVEAILLEVWRRANLTPLSLQRRNLHDTHVGGYFIPKHTTIVPNLWNLHWNPRHFPEPMKFKPERFIDAASNKINRALPNLPFSVGKRACVGEPIARMELFLFLANMLQRIEVLRPENGDALPDLNNFTTGINVNPGPFKIAVRTSGLTNVCK